MNKKTLIKIVSICIISFLIYPAVFANNNKSTDVEPKKTVSIYYDSFDSNDGERIKKKVAEMTIEEAEHIKNKLLETEKKYESEEKIRHQITILRDHGLLPDNDRLDRYISIIDKLGNIFGPDPNQLQQVEDGGYIFTGPSIESTFTLGGQTYPLQTFIGDVLEYYFDIEIFDFQNNDTFNGTHFHSSAYSGPVFVGISPASAFITTLGVVFQGPLFIYSPFVTIRVLFAGAHLSAKIYECVNPITVFDWHLNAALMGVLIYQSSVIPGN